MISAKAIKPHTPFKPSVFTAEIKAAATKDGAAMLADFEKTTKTWKHKPTFKFKVTENGQQTTVTVSTTDKIYGFVDQGTEAHIIKPKHAKVLAFPGGKYRAKTKPHVIGSTTGGASGKTEFVPEVHHPGTEPRYFARDIQAKWQPRLKKDIEQAIARAAKKSGHSAS